MKRPYDIPEDEPICFAFVCQSGMLEAQALLLAASLRRFMPPCHDIVAAVPQPADCWGSPASSTLVALESYGVRCATIANRISPDYPIGNKIDCLTVRTTCRSLVFLDSDVMLLRAADVADLAAGSIAAVPASFTHVTQEDWRRFYSVCGVSAPDTGMRTLVSEEWTPPYFNSGVVKVDSAVASDLASAWSECALRLLALEDLPGPVRRRFLDQISLPIAAAALGRPIAPLASDWNFPSWSWSLADRPRPALFHYQQLSRLLEDGPAKEVFAELVAADDAIADAILATVPDPRDTDEKRSRQQGAMTEG